MLLILLSWIIITFVFLALGNIVVSLWNRVSKEDKQYTFFDTFWLGLCATGVLVSVISLFCPINFYVLLGFLIFTCLYCVVKRKSITALFREFYNQLFGCSIWNKVAVLLIFVSVLFYSLAATQIYDMGLYHLQTMMWTEQYATVPGLGNIHGRLGFNSNFLLLTTLFSYHPDYYTPFFSLNGLCIFIFSIWLVTKIDAQNLVQSLVICITLVFVGLLFNYYASSTSTDTLVSLLIIYLLYSYVLDKENFESRYLAFWTISVFCLTLKLSSGVIAIIPLFIIFRLIRSKEYKKLFYLLLIAFVILLPWLLHFVILTGYLVYPLPSIDIFNFDWKMPIDVVINEKEEAYAWARVPQEGIAAKEVLQMSVKEWFPVWVKYQTKLYLLLYIFGFLSPLFLILSLKRLIRKPLYLLSWITAFTGFLFFVITAPEIRFGFGFVLTSIFVPFLIYAILRNKQPKQSLQRKAHAGISVVFLLALLLIVRYGFNQFTSTHNASVSWLSYILKPQSIDHMKHQTSPAFIEHNVNGIIIYTPDKRSTDQCFDQCLPCTPYLNQDLEMRGETFQSGFRIKSK